MLGKLTKYKLMAKTNVILSERTEETLSKMQYLDRGKTKEKGNRIDFLIEIARMTFENLDDESFLNVTGYKK